MTSEKIPWRLDRSISFGDIAVFAGLLFAGIGYVMHQDARSTKAEIEISTLKETDARHDAQINNVKGDLEKRLDRMEGKIDLVLSQRGK